MLFSIVIPTYNAEKTITKCLNSVFKQNFSNFELIMVNDCSTDKTTEIINQYTLKHHNLKHIKLAKNSGPAAARNRGVRESQGEIIIFIDSDVTFIDSDALNNLAKIFEQRLDIASVVMIKDKIPLNQGLTPLFWGYYKYYLWNQPSEYQTSFTTERSAIKKEIFEKIGYFDEKYKKADVEDFEFGYRLTSQGHKILIARHIKVGHHFETFKQTVKKTLKRSWQWIRLFWKRKKFDNVYSTKERGVKTLIGATLIPLLILSIIIFPVFFIFIVFLFIYIIYNFKFHIFLIHEKMKKYILPFMCLDIFICFLTALGASTSLICLFLQPKNKYD